MQALCGLNLSKRKEKGPSKSCNLLSFVCNICFAFQIHFLLDLCYAREEKAGAGRSCNAQTCVTN